MSHPQHVFPSYTRPEHIADACVHAVSVLFSIAAATLLLIGAIGTLPAAIFIGLIVYSIGLVGMFAASAAYNLVPHHGLKEILRRLDHAAIFVMIAGSYTPFAIESEASHGENRSLERRKTKAVPGRADRRLPKSRFQFQK